MYIRAKVVTYSPIAVKDKKRRTSLDNLTHPKLSAYKGMSQPLEVRIYFTWLRADSKWESKRIPGGS